jgi:hypothetical protein
MRKIMYYAYIGFWITLGLPIVMLIILALWLQDKWHKLNCKKCKLNK